MRLIAAAIALALGFFLARRIRFLALSFRALPRARPDTGERIVILAAFRNEERRAHRLLDALDRLDYPRSRLSILLGDDASSDATGAILAAWSRTRPHSVVLSSARPEGKAAVLNRLLAHAGAHGPHRVALVAVYDAKHAPRPDSLGLLAGACLAPQCGAATGYLDPDNYRASLPARYAALDLWVNQHILFPAKAALGQPVPLRGGNCVFRAAALAAAGGFRPGAYSEDTEAGLALGRLGWKISYVPEARAGTLAAATAGEFWRQRVRWSRGLLESSRAASSLEGWVTALGYADRFAFLAALLLGPAQALPLWAAGLYAAVMAATIPVAVWRGGALSGLPAIALAVLVYAPADLAVSVWAALAHLRRRTLFWR